MKTSPQRLDFSDSCRQATLSIRGKMCEEICGLLEHHDLLDAINIIFEKSPDDYAAKKSGEFSVIFGRMDEMGKLPDW